MIKFQLFVFVQSAVGLQDTSTPPLHTPPWPLKQCFLEILEMGKAGFTIHKLTSQTWKKCRKVFWYDRFEYINFTSNFPRIFKIWDCEGELSCQQGNAEANINGECFCHCNQHWQGELCEIEMSNTSLCFLYSPRNSKRVKRCKEKNAKSTREWKLPVKKK